MIDRLKKFDFVDFNQGLDSRLLTEHHARRFAELKRPILRLALDNIEYADGWVKAVSILHDAGIPKSLIQSYALFGFETDPAEAWERANFIEEHKVKVLPAWYHELDAMETGIVTDKQGALGWTDYKRREIMQWFYWHKKAVL